MFSHGINTNDIRGCSFYRRNECGSLTQRKVTSTGIFYDSCNAYNGIKEAHYIFNVTSETDRLLNLENLLLFYRSTNHKLWQQLPWRTLHSLPHRLF